MMPRLSTILFLTSLVAGPLAPAADTSPINELLAKAVRGDTRAQASLAVRCHDGKGLNQDNAEAMRWGHLAFARGDG